MSEEKNKDMERLDAISTRLTNMAIVAQNLSGNIMMLKSEIEAIMLEAKRETIRLKSAQPEPKSK